MYRVELYAQVRRSVYVEGLSEREAARRFSLARETVRKMLRHHWGNIKDVMLLQFNHLHS